MGNASSPAMLVKDDLLLARRYFSDNEWDNGVHWLKQAVKDLQP